jgi:hypothetical protein
MKRSFQLIGLIAALVTWLTPQALHADPPDIIGSYRFAPLVSTIVPLRNSDFELNVYGTFDFIRGWDYRDDPPSIVRYADFDNVRAWAQNPFSAAPPLDVDAIFNLSGLKGEQLPVASIFDVFRFDGKNFAGDPVEIFVSVLGRWLYLRGQTESVDHPGAGWRINALARQRPFADFDEDGVVDAADLKAWTERAGGWTGMNDADGDDFQTGADFLYWQQQLGEAPPEPAEFDAAINVAVAWSATSIPEPTTFVLLGAAVLAAAVRGVHQRSSGNPPISETQG